MGLSTRVKEVSIDFSVAFFFLGFFFLSSLGLASLKATVFFFQEISGVYETTQIEEAVVRGQTGKTLDYLRGEEIELNYTLRERFHLEETRSLFFKAKRIWLVSAGGVLTIVFLTRSAILSWRERVRVVIKEVAAFFLAADLVTLFFFSSFFERFHRAFFTPGTWQFGPKDLLITLFPYRFWMVEAAFVLSFSVLLSTAVSLIFNLVLFRE